MKILLIGPGSIGQRHLQNLATLGYTNVHIISRRPGLSQSFPGYQLFGSVENALAGHRYDAAILCNPTAFHIPVLLQLLRNKIPFIYIEKPVSHSLEQLDEVLALAHSYTNKIAVGFDLHFDPGIQKVKALIGNGAIGKVISVNAQVGQYLPDWRPSEDHRQGMSAKKETGGGVMLDLVHEFDYLRWLCGPVDILAALYKNTGVLEIETEEVAEVLLRFKNGVIGTIHLDYLQPQLVRNCLVTGEQGTITWNLAASLVQWTDRNKQVQEFSYAGYERNQRFLDIMKSFFETGFDERLTTLAEGIESLAMVVAAKTSCENLQFIAPKTFSTVKTFAE